MKDKPSFLSHWTHGCNDELVGCGNRDFLDAAPMAFFASRQCSGGAIRAAMNWALLQVREKQVVVSGFHSPLEQSVLKVLLTARSPAVAVLARPLQGAKLPPEWIEPLVQRQLAVVSSVATASRLTQSLATARNAQVAQLAKMIVVAHASSEGALAVLLKQWRMDGRQVTVLLD